MKKRPDSFAGAETHYEKTFTLPCFLAWPHPLTQRTGLALNPLQNSITELKKNRAPRGLHGQAFLGVALLRAVFVANKYTIIIQPNTNYIQFSNKYCRTTA